MATIYDLTADIKKLNDLLIEGEIDVEVIRDALINSKEELSIKLEDYAKVIRHLESDIAGIKAEETRLADRRHAIEHNIEHMKDVMMFALIQSGETKVKGQLFTIGIQKSPASVVIDAESIDDIPECYLIDQAPKIDKKLIGDDLKNGTALEGIAHLEQKDSLRIR